MQTAEQQTHLNNSKQETSLEKWHKSNKSGRSSQKKGTEMQNRSCMR